MTEWTEAAGPDGIRGITVRDWPPSFPDNPKYPANLLASICARSSYLGSQRDTEQSSTDLDDRFDEL
jgi:hypothetical protein